MLVTPSAVTDRISFEEAKKSVDRTTDRLKKSKEDYNKFTDGSPAEEKQALKDEQTLNAMLAVDLSAGFIWNELSDQVNRWIERINDYGITKWILYLSALEEGEEIGIKRIQQQLLERDGQQVSIETIKEVLIKLSRGDLITKNLVAGLEKLMQLILSLVLTLCCQPLYIIIIHTQQISILE